MPPFTPGDLSILSNEPGSPLFCHPVNSELLFFGGFFKSLFSYLTLRLHLIKCVIVSSRVSLSVGLFLTSDKAAAFKADSSGVIFYRAATTA